MENKEDEEDFLFSCSNDIPLVDSSFNFSSASLFFFASSSSTICLACFSERRSVCLPGGARTEGGSLVLILFLEIHVCLYELF